VTKHGANPEALHRSKDDARLIWCTGAYTILDSNFEWRSGEAYANLLRLLAGPVVQGVLRHTHTRTQSEREIGREKEREREREKGKERSREESRSERAQQMTVGRNKTIYLFT
jgi:hypothetical protein